MRKWVFAAFALLLIFTTAFYVDRFVKNGNFASAAGFNPLQADRVTVRSDDGRTGVITAREDILSLVACLNGCRYSRDDRQPDETGYLYDITFYSGRRKLAGVVVGSYPIINGIKYRELGSLDTARLRQLVGLYIPRE